MAPRTFKYLVAMAVAATLLGSATESLAVPITVPTGLNPGDEYRLAFVTSTNRNATSADIDDYNAFVTGVANTQAALVSLGTTWKAIASTPGIDARDNTGTNPFVDGAGVPIYLLNDTLLASGNADLWDGAIIVPLGIDETGNPFVTQVWTGTDSSGVGVPGDELGDPGLSSAIGRSIDTNDDWVQFDSRPQSVARRFYALSDVLLVPELGTAALFALGLVALGSIRRSKA